MKKFHKAGGFALLAAAVCAGPALAQANGDDCAARISTLETKLEADSSKTAMERQAFATAFEQAAMFCRSGNETLAEQYLSALEEEFATEEAAADPEPAAEAEPEAVAGPDYGEAREDLERFYGLYALPDNPDRKLFVAPASSGNPDRPIPEGYMMIGAMWGDAANWYMRSVSDTGFEQRGVPEGYQPVVVDFMLDGSGQAEAMSMQSSFMAYDRMERTGDLPEGWD